MGIKPYGSTAARIHGEPGYKKRPSSLTVDAHCHLHVQEAADAVVGLFDPFDTDSIAGPRCSCPGQFASLDCDTGKRMIVSSVWH